MIGEPITSTPCIAPLHYWKVNLDLRQQYCRYCGLVFSLSKTEVRRARGAATRLAPSLPEPGTVPPPKPSRRVKLLQELIARDGWTCFYCERVLTLTDATIDHVLPRSAGGRNLLDNLVLACQPCNEAKDDRITMLLDLVRQLRKKVLDIEP